MKLDAIIISTPEDIAQAIAPYLHQIVEQAIERASTLANDDGRMVPYEKARQITGLGRSRFSQAVNDGTIPYYPNGVRGKLFKIADLRNFCGYKPQTEAEKLFNHELANRK